MSIRNFFVKLADSQGDFANKMRLKRFDVFLSVFNNVRAGEGGRVSILDIGGRVYFWEKMGFTERQDVEIVVLNLIKDVNAHENIKTRIGNACAMPEFARGEFDIVFSNSVIEHVGDMVQQKKMADEIQRVGKKYFLQTPDYWFPFEPHFLMIGFQYLPLPWKAFLLRCFNLGWYKKVDNYDESVRLANSIRLLTRKDLALLFPGATIVSEKFFGLAKSYMVYNE